MIILHGNELADTKFVNGTPLTDAEYAAFVTPLADNKAYWVEKSYNRDTGEWRVVIDETRQDEVSLWNDATEPW